jgi:hypothetical protein
MITGVLIFAISTLLLAYWLRYSCALLLRNAGERAVRSEDCDQRFNFSTVLEQLKTLEQVNAPRELDPLERALERDYHVVTFLIEHAADLELASIENSLLVLDYKVMRAWSRLTRTVAPGCSHRALVEMASVLSVLVAQMGEQNGGMLEV